MSDIIVMAFLPRNIIGCFLKKMLTKGGVTGTPGPPLLRPCIGLVNVYDSLSRKDV